MMIQLDDRGVSADLPVELGLINELFESGEIGFEQLDGEGRSLEVPDPAINPK